MRDTELERILHDRIESYRLEMANRSAESMREGALSDAWAPDAMENYLRTLTAPLNRGTIANVLLTFVIMRAIELTERQVIENTDEGEYELNTYAYQIRQSLFMDNLAQLVKKGMLGITADSHIERTIGPSTNTQLGAGLPDVQQAWADIKGVIASFRYASDTMRMRR